MIDLDGKKKSVYIFYGAPQELIDLQRKLYEVTQIAQYTGRAQQFVDRTGGSVFRIKPGAAEVE